MSHATATPLTVTPWIANELVPSFLLPFTLDATTRFTRTPDYLIRGRQRPEEDEAEREAPRDFHPEEPEPDMAAFEAEDLPPASEEAPETVGRAWSFLAVDEDEAEPAADLDGVLEAGEEEAAPLAEPEPADEPMVAAEEELVAPSAEAEFGTSSVEADMAAEVPFETMEAGGAEATLSDPAPAEDTAVAAMDGMNAEMTALADVPATLLPLRRLITLGLLPLPEPAVEQDLLPPPAEEPEPEAIEAESASEAVAEAIGVEQPAPGFASGAMMSLSGIGWPLYQQTVQFSGLSPAAGSPPDQAEQADSTADVGAILVDADAEDDLAPDAELVPAEQAEDEMILAAQAVEEVAAAEDDFGPEDDFDPEAYQLPSLDLLAEPPVVEPPFDLSEEFLEQNSQILQQTLRDFGVRGEIIDANPGPVVTLYELEPAPGTKSSRVIGLSADIARSMSAISARVAVVEGRNVIGIELPNRVRETVWLRELLADQGFGEARAKLGLCLGKTIGGEPVIADLARMPHLLVAGTTGSGKSVAINTMILSLLYRHAPEACRLIMIDPKMLELSVYEGIPHLLTPVVTDPKKAITALKWAVREMEDRYRKMSRLAVRNIDGFNARVTEASAKGEVITRIVERGFDKETGEMVSEEEVMDLTPLPYIVIIVDEMADLMMVAGKEIEGAIQRLAQMARAAGIHLVMATQRPSVDVITGTIKANFPTRISFQVTSKIDSRTILGEMGAEQLLGQGDMLYMAGGGRITRVHGPFVSDHEVEKVVAHLKTQGRPEYLDAVTSDEEDEAAAEDDGAVFDKSAMAEEGGGDNYEQAVAVVLRDRKASTSYIQRRLQIGYNKAASLMERMEQEGIVGPANHAGKREILASRAPSGL
ncbi:DNA translocase FtsK [Xanthobacteraceae bacterium A53D]